MSLEMGATPEAERDVSLGIVSIILILIVAIAIALRLIWIDRIPGIHGDEGWYGLLAQRWSVGDFAIPRTPTGNFVGPIQPLLVAIGQFILPSQFLTLRIPALLSSLGAMALAWHIGRRHVDPATGRLALMLMAVLPANIVYARFGWDPSHSGLLTLGAVATALNRRAISTGLLYGLAIWTHPTNVFIAPLLLIIFFASDRSAGTLRASPKLVALAVAIALFTAILMATAIHARDFADPSAILSRLADPSQWLVFIMLLARLMAGLPWFEHIAGTDYGALLPLVDTIGIVLLAGTIWFAVSTLRAWRFSNGGIPAGWLAMVAAYALVVGGSPLNAGTERYGFVFIAPTAIVIALALRSWLGNGANGYREAALTGVLGFGMIFATIALYFVPLATRDGPRRVAFNTGLIEPKEATARWLIGQARTDRPIRLVAEGWWLSWPLAYRLSGHPISVINTQVSPDEAKQASNVRTLEIVYVGSPRDRQLMSMSTPAFVAAGYEGSAIVRVWERRRPTPVRTRGAIQHSAT